MNFLTTSIKTSFKPIRLFLDMDGLLVDFNLSLTKSGLDITTFKNTAGVYRTMKPYEGAIEGVKALENLGFELFIATKIPDKNPAAASEKIYWTQEYIPSLAEKVIITPDKGCLGSETDFLVDDRLHKANVVSFRGTVIHFGPNGKHIQNWTDLIEYFKKVKSANQDSCLVEVTQKQIVL